ncbi:hypothetical protein LBMAG37_07410 [Anaerolineae bacterium]|nr:hypothetical protein LBMAG37_07410 [Anaerolineae bacterium]
MVFRNQPCAAWSKAGWRAAAVRYGTYKTSVGSTLIGMRRGILLGTFPGRLRVTLLVKVRGWLPGQQLRKQRE